MGRIVHHLFLGLDFLRVHLLFRKPYQPYWNNREQQGLHKQPTSTSTIPRFSSTKFTSTMAICQSPSAVAEQTLVAPNCGVFSSVGGWGTENSGCWVVKQQPKNTSITLPKFNMEPKNESGSRILILKKKTIWKWSLSVIPFFIPPLLSTAHKLGWFWSLLHWRSVILPQIKPTTGNTASPHPK